MVGDAVGHALDEDGLAAVLEGHFPGLLDGLAHGPDVVAVNADRVYAIANATAGDAVSAVLVQRGRRDGVAVVAADEDDGARARRSNVHGGVEVTFAGSALAEETYRYLGLGVGVLQLLHLQGVAGTRCLRDLRCQRRRNGVLYGTQLAFQRPDYRHGRGQRRRYTHDIQPLAAVMNRHVPPLAGVILIRKQLRHKLLGGHSPLLEKPLLSVLAVHGVFWIQNTRTAHADSLLAGAHHVEAQAALALGIKHDQVHD